MLCQQNWVLEELLHLGWYNRTPSQRTVGGDFEIHVSTFDTTYTLVLVVGITFRHSIRSPNFMLACF